MNEKLNGMSKTELVMLVNRITETLDSTEDAADFCIWLADVLNETTGVEIDLTK